VFVKESSYIFSSSLCGTALFVLHFGLVY